MRIAKTVASTTQSRPSFPKRDPDNASGPARRGRDPQASPRRHRYRGSPEPPRRRDPAGLSARKLRDDLNLKPGGLRLARRTVERLMRELGLEGVIRSKPVRTTISGQGRAMRARLCEPPIPCAGAEAAVAVGLRDLGGVLLPRLRHRRLARRIVGRRVRHARMGRLGQQSSPAQPIGNFPPAEAEAADYAATEPSAMAA